MDIITPLSYTDNQYGALGDSFWMWETLNEAVRADIDTMNLEHVWAVHQAFGLNASEDLMDVLETRFYSVKDSPMVGGTNIIRDGKFENVASNSEEYKHAMEHANHH